MRQVNKNLSRWFLIAGLLFILVVPVFVFAQGGGELPAPGVRVAPGQIAEIPGQAGLALPATDIRIIIARIVRVALGFLGLIALILIIYGGFLWMTAAGNEERIEKAKKVLINATIGLAIILSALAIVQFIIRALTQALGEPPLPAPTPAPARVGGGALGSGMIESHFPFRGATNIPRNTRIIITFKEDIDPASIAERWTMPTGAVVIPSGLPATATAVPPGLPSGDWIFYRDSDGVYQFPLYDLDGNLGTNTDRVIALRLKAGAIQIIRTADIEGSVRESNPDRYLGSVASGADVLVAFTSDLHTFVFTPVNQTDRRQRALFGSATVSMPYTVYICGTASSRGNCAAGGIKLLSGPSAFQGYFKDYQWSFETGTFVDTTPPQIVSVVPFPDNGRDVEAGCPAGQWHTATATTSGFCDRRDKPRNAMLQINFNEAVLPTVASGRTVTESQNSCESGRCRRTGATCSGSVPCVEADVWAAYSRGRLRLGTFDEMRVSIAGPTYIAGEWQLGNQYRTAEFTSTDLCGRNSCGQDIFCLPGNDNITADVYAATLQSPGTGDPTSSGLSDGIEDVAGNSLDGNSNNTAQGPVAFYNRNVPSVSGDNVRWSFWTNDTIDLTPPTIVDTVPNINEGGVPLPNPIEIFFSKPMAMTTFTSRNIVLSGTERATGALWDTWWTLEGENIPPTGDPAQTKAEIVHGGFWRETDYNDDVSSRVRDLFQNCYLPSSGFDRPSGEGRRGCAFRDMSDTLRYCCSGRPSSVACSR